jgi:hypothetical protein
MRFYHVDGDSYLEIEWNLTGVALSVCWEGKDMAVGVCVSPADALLAAAELTRLAGDVETYGTSANPIRLPGATGITAPTTEKQHG